MYVSLNLAGFYCCSVVPCCHRKFLLNSERRSTLAYITANRDHIMREVVAYKRLKTIKNNKTFRTKNDQGRSGGRLREVLIVRT